MDTKWKNAKCIVSLLALFLGLNLTVIASGLVGYYMLSYGPGDMTDAFRDSYQESESFRNQISWYLRSLMDVVVSGPGREGQELVQDMNVRYEVCKGDRVLAGNLRSGEGELSDRKLTGYNFYLLYRNGLVHIWRDGEETDVYGNGIYRGGRDQWNLPGYANRDTGTFLGLTAWNEKEWTDVTVWLAAAEEPVDYGLYSGMYYVADYLKDLRTITCVFAVLLALGALLVLWSVLWRRWLSMAWAAVGRFTGHVWLEIKLMLLLGLLYSMAMGTIRLISGWRTGWHLLMVLLGLWLLAVYCNDLVRNWGRLRRGSFCGWVYRNLRAAELKLPVQKRLVRRSLAVFVLGLCLLLAAAVFLTLCVLSFGLIWHGGRRPLLLFLVAGAVFLGAGAFLFLFWRDQRALAEDIGTLSGQAEAIRDGESWTGERIVQDRDLWEMSEALRDIQSGVQRAVEDRTRSERMKVELIANVSHDLKTPLTSILSYADLLSKEELPPTARDYVTILNEKAQRLGNMVQEVFEVSKAASGELSIKWERLDLAKLLRQTLADQSEPIEESGLCFRVELPGEPVFIRADGDRLYRVFQNLIQNALKYALEGSRVYVSLTCGEGKTTARIQNISRDELPRGVDFTARFVRGDESRTDGGSGLGLAIADSFTRACGGSFQVTTDADLFTACVIFDLWDGEE